MNPELTYALTLPSNYFSKRPYTRKLWDVWNDRRKQAGKWFGASPVAWKITNLYRLERELWGMDTLEQWVQVVTRELSPEDWDELGKQATRLWSYFSPEERVSFTAETATQWVLRKIIIDTHTGLSREYRSRWEYLPFHYPTLQWRYATPVEDRNTGFDIFGETESGQLAVAVSVKPASYRSTHHTTAGNKNKELVKHRRFIEEHPGVEVFQLSDTETGQWLREPVLASLLG